MSLPQVDYRNLNVYFNREEIIRATLLQIQKDFALFKVKLDWDGNMENAIENITASLLSAIRDLIDSNDRIFLSVLYQIDLSEKSIGEARRDNPGRDHYELLAGQIIARELQKVLTREFFRHQSI